MDHRMLDRVVPLVYAGLILASALFFRAALAGIAIFGALALAMVLCAIRQRPRSLRRTGSRRRPERRRRKTRSSDRLFDSIPVMTPQELPPRPTAAASWDLVADDYQHEHGDFLRDVGFVWCPEGLDEADARLLGPVVGRRVLEIGTGAGQCARWLVSEGARVVGIDLVRCRLSFQHSHRIDDATGMRVAVACASATALPIASESVDIACSAFGAFPFIVDIEVAFREVTRVLARGGRLVMSVVHPTRWMFPDDPSAEGVTVVRSYFDRNPYVETDSAGQPTYVEPHHTLEDWTRALTIAGLDLVDLHEPVWPPGHERVWGAWGPVRGALVPGTLIISARKR